MCSGAAQVKEDGLGNSLANDLGLDLPDSLIKAESFRNLGSKLSEHAQTGLSFASTLLDDTDEEEDSSDDVSATGPRLSSDPQPSAGESR